MKKEELDKLLERYYAGETSAEEEQRLKEYFSGEDVFPEFDAEKEIFSHYESREKIPVPSVNFEDRIINAIDDLEKEQKRISLRMKYIAIISGAAAVLLLVFSYFFFINEQVQEDTFSDPQLAYAETMKILYEVSVKLNKGTEALKPLNKMQCAMEKGLESVDRSASVISANLQQSRLFENEKGKDNN